MTKSEIERIERLNPHTNRVVDEDAMLRAAMASNPEKASAPYSGLLRFGGWSAAAAGMAAVIAVAGGVVNQPADPQLVAATPSTGSYAPSDPNPNALTAAHAPTYLLDSVLVSGRTQVMPPIVGDIYAASLVVNAYPDHKTSYVAALPATANAKTGHIYQLRALAKTGELAVRLAKIAAINNLKLSSQPGSKFENYNAQAAADGTRRRNGYAGPVEPKVGQTTTPTPHADNYWVSTDRYASISGEVGYQQRFDYNDNRAYAWLTCHQSKLPYASGCTKIQKEALPSLRVATSYAKSVLSSLAMASGTTLQNTPDGGYLLKASPNFKTSLAAGALTSGDSAGNTANRTKAVSVIGNLVVGGHVTSVETYFYWYEGSARVASFGGTLASVKDYGEFPTATSKATVSRMPRLAFSGSANLPETIYWSRSSSNGLNEPGSALTKRLWACAATEPRYSGVVHQQWALRRAAGAHCTFKMVDGIPQMLVRVTRAQPNLLAIGDTKNHTWLVPGFNFYDPTGYLGSVYSVKKGLIQTIR